MADTLTLTYEFIKPQVGGSSGTWGGKLNGDYDGIDLALSVPRVARLAPTVGGTTPIDVSAATVHKFTVSQATTVTPSGWAVDTTPGKWAQRVWLQITNGGAFATSWSGVTWLSGVVPTLKVAGVDVVELFTVDNGVTVYGVHHGVIEAASILTAMVADSAIATAKIADGAVSTVKLADGAVTPVKRSATPRVKIHPSADSTIGGTSDNQISWTGPTSDYNIGTFTVSAAGITAPTGAVGMMVLIAEIALGAMGDPSDDANAKIEMRIMNGATIIAETFWQLDAQNSSGQGVRMQCMATVDSPNNTDVFVVKVKLPASVGTPTVIAAKSWFAAHIV